MPYDPAIDGVSQTLLTTFNACRKKAKLMIEGYQPIRRSIPLSWGSFFHAILDKYYTESDDVNLHCENEFNRLIAENTRMSAEDISSLEKIRVEVQVVATKYVEYWKKRDSELSWQFIERPFEVSYTTISKRTVKLRGQYDGGYILDDKLWLLETKTRGRIEEEQVSETLSRDFQINFYLLALSIEYRTIPSGVLYNIIRRPSLRLGNTERLHEYESRLRADVEKDPESYFKRFEVIVDEEDIAMFKFDLDNLLGEFLDWWNGLQWTRRYGMPCIEKYGLCQYVPICFNNEFHKFQTKPLFHEINDV